MTFNVYRLMKISGNFLTPLFCGLLFLAPVSAKPKPKKTSDDQKLFQKKLPKDEQLIHALDRLTFGPRPGDVDRLKRVGLKKWIDQQLHPDRLAENPILETHLQELESLHMTPLETLQHYPQKSMILAIANGRQPMPDDPLLRASVERLIARYRVKQAEAAGAAPPARDPNADLEPLRSLDEILTPAELEIVRGNNNLEQKRQLLEAMQ